MGTPTKRTPARYYRNHSDITGDFMEKMLTEKKILLGVSGGIAAYKTAELIRLLRNAGAQVQVVMTDHAKQFISPLTLQVLSGKPVYDNLFDNHFENVTTRPDYILIKSRAASLRAQAKQSSSIILTSIALDCFACARNDGGE